MFVSDVGTRSVGRFAPRLASISRVLGVLYVIQFFENKKSRSISHLIKVKSKYLQKLLKYFHVTKNSVSSLLLPARVFPIIFVLHLKIHLLLYLHYFSYKYHHYFRLHHHSLHIFYNSANFLMS